MDRKIWNISIIVSTPVIPGPGNLLKFPRYGPTVIATILRNAGYQVKLYDESIQSLPDIRLIVKESDLILFSAKTGAISKVQKIIGQIKRYQGLYNKTIMIILGGEHASMAPEHALECMDINYLLKGEGDESILELVKALEAGTRIEDIEGLAYKDKNKICVRPGKGMVSIFDEPIPDLFLVEGYRDLLDHPLVKYFPFLWNLINKSLLMISFQGSRGCPYSCKFCPTKDLQGKVYRRRGIESSIEYLKQQAQITGLKRVIFEDPLGALDNEEFSRFVERLIEEDLRLRLTVLARIEIYRNEELLKKMKRAGFKNLSIGIESLNEKSLEAFNKKTNLEDIKRAIDTFHRYGFSVTSLFVTGTDFDTIKDVFEIRDFCQEYGLEKWRISPLGLIPEKDGQMLPPWRVFTWNEFDFCSQQLSDYCTGDFVTYYPKQMKPSELQQTLFEITEQSMSLGSLIDHFCRTSTTRGISSTIRRLGTTIGYKSLRELSSRSATYLEMLRRVEDGLYNVGSILNEDRLKQRYRQNRERER